MHCSSSLSSSAAPFEWQCHFKSMFAPSPAPIDMFFKRKSKAAANESHIRLNQYMLDHTNSRYNQGCLHPHQEKQPCTVYD
mmetsp:Transcript_25370/g.43039  ORF Transcript_25370/g.43039 Transcript_25370/m.43039 type:complete len:81 (-) Transcript_25370:2507-2749(-)